MVMVAALGTTTRGGVDAGGVDVGEGAAGAVQTGPSTTTVHTLRDHVRLRSDWHKHPTVGDHLTTGGHRLIRPSNEYDAHAE
jgi:hypothetical protein